MYTGGWCHIGGGGGGMAVGKKVFGFFNLFLIIFTYIHLFLFMLFIVKTSVNVIRCMSALYPYYNLDVNA